MHEWLAAAGIEDFEHTPAEDWIRVVLSVEHAERLLDTEYYTYEHEDGTRLVRATAWSLPLHLHSHIDTIQPTTSFFRTGAAKAKFVDSPPFFRQGHYKPGDDRHIDSLCDINSVTPECFMALYNTKGYVPKAAGKNQIGFTNYLGEIPIRADTAQFLKKYRPEAVETAYSFKLISVNGGPVQDGPLNASQAEEGISREANLDLQAIASINYPTPIKAWSTGGQPPFNSDLKAPTNTNEVYLTWVNYLFSQGSFPQVITTSYGDDEQTVPKAYAERVCQQFARVGAQGTSLLFSSGDKGVGLPGTCLSNDGKNTTMFLPSFPASCPYVTTIGATMHFTPEIVAYKPAHNDSSGTFHSLYASGAGFSNYFVTPAYQTSVVNTYISNLGNRYEGLYNKQGRGYPDLAAQGLYFAYVWNGTEGTISGTSASCPLVGGIFSLVNDALIAAGKPSLGFLNPWLYKKGYKGLNDVVGGTSHGCGTEGFPAAVGWDPVTGFGTPDFRELVKLAGVDLAV